MIIYYGYYEEYGFKLKYTSYGRTDNARSML